MKKQELKIALDRIHPRESLIYRTIENVNQYKTRRTNKAILSYRKMAVVGAFCVLLLIAGIGRIVSDQGAGTPVILGSAIRIFNIGEDKDSKTEAVLSDNKNEQGWIVADARVVALDEQELTESDQANKAIRKYEVVLVITGFVEEAENLNYETVGSGDRIEADLIFYDKVMLKKFLENINSEMKFQVIPDGAEKWTIVEFIPLE